MTEGFYEIKLHNKNTGNKKMMSVLRTPTGDPGMVTNVFYFLFRGIVFVL